MKIKHLLLPSIVIILASCSSAYRIGQTPDDVYYSPAPAPQAEYVTSNNQKDKDSYAYNNSANNQDMPASNAYNQYPYSKGGRSSLSLGYGYNPYNIYGSSLYNPYSLYSPYNTGLTFSPYYNSFYSPYFNSYNSGYSNYYSPYDDSYYYPVNYGSKSSYSQLRGPRKYNLNAYNVNNNVTRDAQPATTTPAPVRATGGRQRQPVNESGAGGFVRRIFTPSNNTTNTNTRSYNNNNNSSPVRETNTSTGSSSSSSSSGSNGGGSAPSRSFRH